METLPKFIVIWKDLTNDTIYRTKTTIASKSFVKLLYDDSKNGLKLLFLFRIKKVKYGSMPIPLLLQ
jgi:hypothetical protein